MSAKVSVSGLHKGYGAHPVLRGVSIDVEAGSLTAVLGPSGSGKTTLLRALAGFARPESGTISLGGRVVDGPGCHVPPNERRIGYVPQEGALFPHLDVAANIGFGLHGGKRTDRTTRNERKERVAELLEVIGLPDLGHRYPHQLSGGQQQRVALARALATQPELVLLDEPFSSLDAGLRAAVRAEVREILKKFGMTAILVTHDQDEALSLADRVVVLRDGTVVQQDTPQELYEAPVDASLARFVGEANLVTGLVSGDRVRSMLGMLSTRIDLAPLRAADKAEAPGEADAASVESEAAREAVSGIDAAPLPDGTRVTALIRPEQIRVLPEGSGELEGRVVACEYFGHDTLLSVAPEEPADQGAPNVLVRTGYAGSLPVGARVSLSVTGPVTVWAPAEVQQGSHMTGV